MGWILLSIFLLVFGHKTLILAYLIVVFVSFSFFFFEREHMHLGGGREGGREEGNLKQALRPAHIPMQGSIP